MNLPHLVPDLDDPDTAEHFRAAGEGRLVVRACDDCGQSLHLPRVRCFACGSMSSSWVDVGLFGAIWTWTVVEHQVHPQFPAPFTSILVELDERPDVRFAGYLPGRPRIDVGTPVHAVFTPLPDGCALPGWALDDPSLADPDVEVEA